ncbi:sugar ABC transporter permease [Eisenbergiella tayi]|uniref:Sugar ABC transporter permease n=2 Tax=Lachnospiraceae TaxID=186803 RepID=A0A6N7W0P6_9FIRM|nr:sugar ABC transporter permease [Eisenbergiella porci]
MNTISETDRRRMKMEKKKKRNILKNDQFQIQSMIWPGLILCFIFSYIPMYGITIAFKDYNILSTVTGAQWVGFKYFGEFFNDPALWNVLRNTIMLNGLALVFSFPAPIILALFLNELKNVQFKKTVQTISYLPHFLSWVIFGGIVIEMLMPGGVISTTLYKLGLIAEPVNFMAKGEYFYGIYTVINIIKTVGFGSILYVAAITGIDQELYEAAIVDGCGRFQKMWYITIPCITGTIVIMLIFQISSILNTGYEQIILLQNSLNLAYSETLDTYVYKIGIAQSRYSYAAAVGLLKSVMSVALMLLANSTSKKLLDRGLF